MPMSSAWELSVSDRIFLCGAYKYGYVLNTTLVRYDYQSNEWSVACAIHACSTAVEE